MSHFQADCEAIYGKRSAENRKKKKELEAAMKKEISV